MRTLEIMNSNASSDIQGIVTDLLNSRPYSHRQDADPSVAAVITAQSDLRFFPSTFAAVLAQRVLPGTIIVADCTNQVEQPMQMTFDVIPSPAGVLTEVPESKTIRVVLVGVKGATSFTNAVSRAMRQIDLDAQISALWTLHDDSRPADESCLEALLDAWRNTPTASLLGAKQLDWQAKSLHNVGLYAGRHNLVSLVVDGEPDQEQYDGRQDVLAVSLSGALVPLATLRTWKGADSWFGTFAESTDLCRRICLGGGRVVVVPQARIAHRRARFEGVRSKSGQQVGDEDGRIDPYLAKREANTKYAYTDVHRSWWLLLWIWSFIKALGLAVLCLTRKQPYHACCELALPWRSLLCLPGAWRARARLREQSKVSLKSLSALQAGRQQIKQWNDRKRAFLDQRGTVILSPLAKAHLRKRLMRRWGFALTSALIAFAWIVFLYWNVFRSVLSGASMYSHTLLPTDAGFAQLVRAATTSWAYTAGTGVSAPSAPWLLVLMVVSAFTAGHVATAVAVVFFLSAPLMVLSFWALAGIFTRSDTVRCVTALAWFSIALSMSVYNDADVAMITVMVFLPAAFAFSFRAVGMYRTEDLLKPQASVQANAVRYAGAGTWRQIFGNVMLPSSAHDGRPMIVNLSDIVSRAFGVTLSGEAWQYAAVAILALIVLLAAVSLFLPFVLRVSRMMWVAGLVTSLLSAAVVVAVDSDGAVAGSVLPGVSFTMMGLLSCVCMVAGSAVQRFVMLWQRPAGDIGIEEHGSSEGIIAGHAVRIVLVVLIAASVVASAGFDFITRDHDTVAASDSGLPIVASDFLAQDEARRVLAVRADSTGSISYSVMRTRRGDLIDSSPAQRVEVAFGRSDDASKAIAKDCAQLLSNADSDAVTDLSELGFGGIYVVRSGDDKAQKQISDQLSSNISASDGTQNVVSTDAGTYYRLTIQDTAKQHIDRKGYRQAESSVWRHAWLWCMGVVIAAYCLVAFPRMRRQGQEEA